MYVAASGGLRRSGKRKDRMKLSLNPQFSKELGFNNMSNARELNPQF